MKAVVVRRIGVIVGASFAIAGLSLLGLFLWATSGKLTRRDYERGFVHVAEELSAGQADGRYTIVTYNVGYGSGLTNNTGNNASEADYEANVAAITRALRGAGPDIVACQEIDYESDRAYHHDQLAILADALEMKYRAQAFNWDTNYVPWPYWPPNRHFGRILSGQTVSSRFPVRGHSKLTLPMPQENPFWYNLFYLDRIVQITELEVGDEVLVVMNLHLEAYDVKTREAQSTLVAKLVRQYPKLPVIILGDFNAELPWRSKGEQTMANILAAEGFRSAIPEEAFKGDGAQRQFTAPSNAPRGSIDHILHNERIECLSARVIRDAGTGSDHLPVMMEFAFVR